MNADTALDDLRVAVARAANELLVEHRPIWSSDYAQLDAQPPVGCEICWPRDGHWPCTSRLVADDLRTALEGTR